MLAFRIILKLLDDLHWMCMLSVRINFTVSCAQLRGEQVALGRSDVGVVSLHLELLIDIRRDSTTRW